MSTVMTTLWTEANAPDQTVSITKDGNNTGNVQILLHTRRKYQRKAYLFLAHSDCKPTSSLFNPSFHISCYDINPFPKRLQHGVKCK